MSEHNARPRKSPHTDSQQAFKIQLVYPHLQATRRRQEMTIPLSEDSPAPCHVESQPSPQPMQLRLGSDSWTIDRRTVSPSHDTFDVLFGELMCHGINSVRGKINQIRACCTSNTCTSPGTRWGRPTQARLRSTAPPLPLLRRIGSLIDSIRILGFFPKFVAIPSGCRTWLETCPSSCHQERVDYPSHIRLQVTVTKRSNNALSKAALIRK
jgi:hypothetical protein